MAKKKKQKKAVAPPPPVARKAPRAEAAPAGPTKRQLEREAQQKAARREALRRKLVAAGLAVAAVAAVAAYVVRDRQQDAELREALTSGSCEVDTEADEISGGDGHVASPRYTVDPPAGGDHLAAPASSGVYEGASVPPDGQLVHSLEHGYIVVWHAPNLPDEQKEQLAEFASRHEPDVIVAEHRGNPVPVAATAWGDRLLCQAVEPDALDRFYSEHVGDGPEDVERT